MSELADKPNTNNLPGFKNRRVDQLCEQYDRCFEQADRVAAIREIDKRIYDEHPYALGWFSGRVRLLFWDRFGHSDRYFARTGDERNILSEWWFDPEKDARLKRAMAAGEKLEQGPVDVAPWDDAGGKR